eukprot:COSAG01_NODE_4612_length_4878_cov_15.581502_7_plen_154_part_00
MRVAAVLSDVWRLAAPQPRCSFALALPLSVCSVSPVLPVLCLPRAWLLCRPPMCWTETPQLTRPDGLVVRRYGLLDDTPGPSSIGQGLEQRPPPAEPLTAAVAGLFGRRLLAAVVQVCLRCGAALSREVLGGQGLTGVHNALASGENRGKFGC